MSICRRMSNKLFALIAIFVLTGCGVAEEDASLSTDSDIQSACPPSQKSGLSATQRAGGIESLERYSKWQKELPPKSCAGSLASYIPDLPSGYGLPPSVRPPIMTEGHVYLKYAEIPEDISDDALELFNFGGSPQFEFEIVQLSKEESDKFKDWFKNNPKSYSDYSVGGRSFYAVGGGWYLPGNKLSGGLGTILDNNILIKFSMPKMYVDDSIPEPIAQLFHEIAAKNGQ